MWLPLIKMVVKLPHPLTKMVTIHELVTSQDGIMPRDSRLLIHRISIIILTVDFKNFLDNACVQKE